MLVSNSLYNSGWPPVLIFKSFVYKCMTLCLGPPHHIYGDGNLFLHPCLAPSVPTLLEVVPPLCQHQYTVSGHLHNSIPSQDSSILRGLACIFDQILPSRRLGQIPSGKPVLTFNLKAKMLLGGSL